MSDKPTTISDQEYFFDLHCHPSSKSFLTFGKRNPWQKVRGKWIQLVAPIIKSQSCLEQLVFGKVKLGVHAVVPIETSYSKHWIFKRFLSLFHKLSKPLLVASNTGEVTYNQLFRNEVQHLLDHSYRGPSGTELELL